MGKIIVLVGSVRKGGNTQLLAEAFAEGARQYHAVELVYPAEDRPLHRLRYLPPEGGPVLRPAGRYAGPVPKDPTG